MTDKVLFAEVFESLQQSYDGLEMRGTLVYYHDECKFNTDGFNFLYNITRLCDVLKDELR